MRYFRNIFNKENGMLFRAFKQNKLWRDKLVTFREQEGSKVHWRRLDDAEFALELKNKFQEEAAEVCSAKTREALIEELADVLEVLNALGTAHNFTLQDVVAAQKKKHHERGGFEGRKFVTHVEHPVGSSAVDYCLNDPEKYPEIK